jgi:hypothetical protein
MSSESVSGGVESLTGATEDTDEFDDCGSTEPKVEGDAVADNAQSLHALEGIRCVEGGIYIRGEISELKALKALERARGLYLDSSAVISLEGLENLKKVDYLYIDRNPELESLAALSDLVSVEKALRIGQRSGGPANTPEDGNDKLVDLSGLEGVRVAPFIAIDGNDNLIDVEALGGVREARSVDARNNSKLAVEAIEALATKLGAPTMHCGNLDEVPCNPDGD